MTHRDYTAPAAVDVDWAELAEEADRPLPARRDTFVPAQANSGYTLPNLAGSADQDTALMAAAASATAVGAGGGFEHTSATDRARADALRTLIYGAGLALLALALAAWLLEWNAVAVIIGGMGAGILIAAAVSHRASLRYSAFGVAMAKLDTMRGMHRDTLASRERIAEIMVEGWLEHVKETERTTREAQRHGRHR